MYIYFQRFVLKSNITNNILIHWYISNIAYTKLLENVEKNVKKKKIKNFCFNAMY